MTDPPHARRQEICFQSGLVWAKPLHGACFCAVQCGYCFHGSASFIKLRRERDLGQWYRPSTRPRGWVTEAWYYHLASSPVALKSLLGKQISDCCGGKKKVKTGWDYELFHGVCPNKSEKFSPWSVSLCNTCPHFSSLWPPLQIVTMDEVSKIGKISKQWTGLLREAFTDSDNFGIQFPMDLDVRMKAVMIGACFLIVRK